MQSPSIPRIFPLHLHPVEAFLALLLLSVSALHRLVVDPPRPIRRRKRFYALDEVDSYPVGAEEELLSLIAHRVADWKRQPLVRVTGFPLPAVTVLPPVAELRTMARQRGLSQAGSRPIHKARRADLIAVLFPPHLNNG